MRKALLGIAVLAGAAVAVFIAAVLSVYYAQEKASRAGYYTLHNIDAERGIFSETGDFLGEKWLYYNKNGEPAVSYTHLDVYKRQPTDRTRLRSRI